MNKYSITSNNVKLLKHLDVLKGIQCGQVRPIMVHVIPPHRCQLDCVHCCFKNRSDGQADMPLDIFLKAVDAFRKLGVKAIELSGGGEPTLWPHLNVALGLLHLCEMHIGIITNGIALDKVRHWEWFDWVRVSLNTLDYRDTLDLSHLREAGVPVSFCYIWNEKSPETIDRVVKFCEQETTVCRVAPDCIKPVQEIENDMEQIRGTLPLSDYVFLSDFNVQTKRHNHQCRIHMIKPCLYLDGWVYACPSAELAVENERQVQPKTRICRYDEIQDWYSSEEALVPRDLDCSYCKYADQQKLLEDVMTETEFNEFA
jgi:MoaA/NifB/PqqE/SkfB family radical SAM enzyme